MNCYMTRPAFGLPLNALLDYTGTAKCGPVKYDGVTYIGTIDASTHPEFVTGGGTLEAVSDGTVLLFR